MRFRHRDKGNRVNLEPKADVFGCFKLRTDASNSMAGQLYGTVCSVWYKLCLNLYAVQELRQL